MEHVEQATAAPGEVRPGWVHAPLVNGRRVLGGWVYCPKYGACRHARLVMLGDDELTQHHEWCDLPAGHRGEHQAHSSHG